MATDKLTDKFCKNAPKGKHFDGGGLHLLVDDKGGRYWRQKYRRPDGKEDTLSHGVYPHVTLAEARDKRREAKKLIDAGIDPKAHQRKTQAAAVVEQHDDRKDDPKAERFATVAERYYDKHYRAWSATHRRDVRRMLDNDLIPALGELPMGQGMHAEFQGMIDAIVARGSLTVAKDVKTYYGAIRRYFNKLLPEGEPEIADASSRADLPKPPKERGHPALAPQEIGPFLRTLEHSDAGAVVRIAVRMLLLTAVRTTELREATWGEFDTKAALWRIDAERMKADRGHIVPLSKQAIALLAALRPHTGGKMYLFPNGRDDDRPMSENAILAAIKRMGYRGRLTGHGMRSMFSTWAHESGYSSDAIERQLAHAPADKVKAAYLRSEFMPVRTTMLQAWADWLDASAATADVITLQRAG